LDYLEIARREIPECRIEDIVVPARVMGTGDVHIGAIVGDDQPVLLHRAKDLLHVRITGALRNIYVRF